MKLKYIITSLVAVCLLAIGCTKSYPTELDNIQVSMSTIGLDADATRTLTVNVTAKAPWAIQTDIPSWLSVTPTSGPAGQSTLTFRATAKSASCNKVTLTLSCDGQTQHIYVQQGKGAAINTPETAFTPDEAIEFYDGGKNKGAEVYVKGVVVTSKIDLSYGNAEFYLESTKGTFEFYRCFDFDGEKFTDAEKVQPGDIIMAVGSLTEYGSIIELAEGCKLIEIEKSLISVCNDGVLSNIEKAGATVDLKVVVKGKDFKVKAVGETDAEVDWVAIRSIDTKKAEKKDKPDTTVISVAIAPNDAEARSCKLDVSSETSTVSVTVSQKGAVSDCTAAEFNAKVDGPDEFRVSGIVTQIAGETDKYGSNFYIQDATGKVYVYGTVDSEGKAVKISSKGVEVGDIVTVVGPKSSYNGSPQMKNGVYQEHKDVATVTAADVATLADDDKNNPQHYVMITGKVTKPEQSLLDAGTKKWDITQYGNFDLVDETGTIYVYGVSTGWNGETKKFGTHGVQEGDILTIVAYKTSYREMNQLVGMYVSHEQGGVVPPEPAGDDMVISTGDVPTQYPTAATTFRINGYDYSLLNVANYGDGIQMKKNGGYISSLTAAKRAIASVRVDANMAKYPADAQYGWDPSNIKLYVKATADGAEVPVEGVKDDTGVTYTVAEGDYKFFTLKNESTFAVYLDKITATVVAE